MSARRSAVLAMIVTVSLVQAAPRLAHAQLAPDMPSGSAFVQRSTVSDHASPAGALSAASMVSLVFATVIESLRAATQSDFRAVLAPRSVAARRRVGLTDRHHLGR